MEVNRGKQNQEEQEIRGRKGQTRGGREEVGVRQGRSQGGA